MHGIDVPIDSAMTIAESEAPIAEEIEGVRRDLFPATDGIDGGARKAVENRPDSRGALGRIEDEPRRTRGQVAHEEVMRTEPVTPGDQRPNGLDRGKVVAQHVG